MTRLLIVLVVFCVPQWAAAERHVLIVAGPSGESKFLELQQQRSRDLVAALKGPLAVAEANLLLLSEDGPASTQSTAANIRRALAGLGKRMTADDQLLLVLIGHGTFDGQEAKFNLVGPDLTAQEWRGILDDVPGRVAVVNTASASFPFLEALSRRGRIVITATDSAAQRFATAFPAHFIEALHASGTDADRNGGLSLWEVFVAASAAVKRHYEQRGQLATERPVLDDDGDGDGREAEAPGSDGALARGFTLGPERGGRRSDPAVLALDARRTQIEAELAHLQSRRGELPDADYRATLERLLLELARVTQSIRAVP